MENIQNDDQNTTRDQETDATQNHQDSGSEQPQGQGQSQGEFAQQGQGATSEASGNDTDTQEPLGADQEHGALGGSVTAAGGSSTQPGVGQTGFVGSNQDEDSGEYLQERSEDDGDETTSESDFDSETDANDDGKDSNF